MSVASYFQRGTKESITRITSFIIIISGVLAFMSIVIAFIVCLFIRPDVLKDVSGFDIGIVLSSIIAYIALGVTGKYYGTKLEVEDRRNTMSTYGDRGFINNEGGLITIGDDSKTE